MRVDSSHVPAAAPTPPNRDVAGVREAAAAETSRPAKRFSVLNDFRYLTDADKDLLRHATGEQIEPGMVDHPGSASPFAQQLALDRRTGALAPSQVVTSVYLNNRAQEIDARNYGRPNLRNPYAGADMTNALAYLDSIGRSRADLRL